MASLVLKRLEGERTFRLEKTVTFFGRDPACDVHVDGDLVAMHHGHILRDEGHHRLFATHGEHVVINGKRERERVLLDGDDLAFGEVHLVYRIAPDDADRRERVADRAAEPSPERVAEERAISVAGTVPLEAFKKLYRFSSTIALSPTLEALKKTLVDLVVELAGADTGFLIVLDGSAADSAPSLTIDVGRDRLRRDLPRQEAKISDSIVLDVVKSRVAVFIPDAQEDSAFSGSRSVVNFKLRSVICAPIVLGDELLGVLYLGSDRIVSSASPPEFLDVLGVFAAQAGLLVKNAMLVKSLRDDNDALKEELTNRTFGEIVGECPSMRGVFKAITRFAPTDISALILGETGTGKELVAREIHRRSSRGNGPFVAINVSAIPESLLEAELFGHVRGAFTGAIADRRGKFAQASGGTLFLDEIGDMPLSLQSKILRVLQERSLEQVGSNRSQPIDIRLISATHKDLKRAQAEGTFRPDLYFRLNEVLVSLPPLRERGDDVALLAKYYLSKYAEQMNRKIRRFTPRALAAMKRYAWPGNVRELEGKIKKAVVMCELQEIDASDLELGPELAES